MRMYVKQGMAGLLFVAAVVILGAGVIAGEEEGGRRRRGEKPRNPEVERRGPRDEAVRAFMEKQAEARREFFKAQHEARAELRETLEDKAPQEACRAILDQHKARHGETQAFMSSQYDKWVGFISAHMEEKGVSAEDQKKRLDGMQEHHETRQAEHQKHSDKVVKTLTKLSGKEDLTKEELHKALQRLRPRRPGPGQRGPRGQGKDGPEGRARPRKGGGRRVGPPRGEKPEQV